MVAMLDDNPRLKGLMMKGIPVLGASWTIRDIINKYRNHGVEITRVVVTMPAYDVAPQFRKICKHLQLDGRICVEYFEGLPGLTQSRTHPTNAEGHRSQSGALDIGLGTSRGRYLAGKRVFDVAASLVTILLFSPVYLLLSMLVAIDVGRPLIFWQERPGRFQRTIRVYKFRTMKDAFDANVALRRSRLDELPQLFNILLGDMSFVGPRPLLPIDQPPQSELRLSMRPGLTGWAQVNGGRDLSLLDKRALDLWYIDKASFMTDMKIIWQTLRFVLMGEASPEERALREAYALLDEAANARRFALRLVASQHCEKIGYGSGSGGACQPSSRRRKTSGAMAVFLTPKGIAEKAANLAMRSRLMHSPASKQRLS